MGKCLVCRVKDAPYTCPKCLLVYCSSDCFKSPDHLDCSEKFFKDQVIKELALSNDNILDVDNDDDQKRKVYEMLQRNSFDLEDDSGEMDEEDAKDLDEYLDGLSIEELLGLLTVEQRMDFEQKLKQNKLYVKPWEPWWLRPKILINEDGKDDEIVLLKKALKFDFEKHQSDHIAAVKIPASVPDLMPNIAEIVLCYVFTCLSFNGDFSSGAEVATWLRDHSYILSHRIQSFSSLQELESYIRLHGICVQSGMDRNGWMAKSSEMLGKDCITHILADKQRTLVAITHMHYLFSSASERKFKSCLKTLDFLFSFLLQQ